MSVTVKDVAREAGVSRTTVSNVFGGKKKFSDETREAVLAAAQKLGYKPNLAARSLITNKTGLVGLVLPSYLDIHTLTNSPFYNIVIDGIYSVLRGEAYYDLIIFSVPYVEKLTQVSEWIDARNVDGILTIGEYDQEFLKELNDKNIPVILIDNYEAGKFSNFSYINSDDETGGYLATRRLIERGYTRIALCSAALHSPLMQQRQAGYQRAIAEAGLAEYIFRGGNAAFDVGKQLGEQILAEQMQAAFCTEDLLAMGVMHYLLRQGVQVGQNFGLVGFDNVSLCHQITPELTTIDQNIFEKGITATQTLLNILHGAEHTRIILPVNLVSRETA